MVAALLLPLILNPQTSADAVRQRLLEMHQGASFPGMTAAWTNADGQTFSVAIGLSEKEPATAMRSNDRILAGSIGKMYFAAQIMRMVEAGKLDLDRKVIEYVPDVDWFRRLPNGPDLTLRNLMTHESGIPEHVAEPEFVKAMFAAGDKDQTPEELLRWSLDKKPLFEAGKGWSYADTNFIVASFVAEKVAGKPLYGIIEAEILNPLGLNQTTPSTDLRGLIQGYSMPNSPFGITGPMMKGGKFAFNPQMEWAGGGFVSTSADLSKWAKALFEGKVVQPKTVDQMIGSGVPAKTGPGDKYGLGVQIRTSEYGPSWGHGGWFPGYLSEVEYFPEHQVAIAVQFNTDEMRALGGRPRKYLAEVARLVIPAKR